MNPDFEFGQAIRNRTWGRGAGLIDARPLLYVTAGIEFARRAPGWDPSLDAPRQDWFSRFLRWMRDSGNNHATFFDFSRSYFPGLAGMGLPRRPWADLERRTVKPSGAWLNLYALLLDVWGKR